MPDQTFSEELYDDKALKDAVDRMANLIKTHATKAYVDSAVEEKQDALIFDITPTASSTNPVTSGGVKTALDAKQDTLRFDNEPTYASENMVSSGAVYEAVSELKENLSESVSDLKSALMSRITQFTWINGSLSSALDGIMLLSGYNNRLSTCLPISIDDFISASCGSGGKFSPNVYDSGMHLLGHLGAWLSTVSKTDIVTRFSAAKYVRIVFKRDDGTDCQLSDVSTYSIVINTSIREQSDLEASKHYQFFNAFEHSGISANGTFSGVQNAKVLRLPYVLSVTGGKTYTLAFTNNPIKQVQVRAYFYSGELVNNANIPSVYVGNTDVVDGVFSVPATANRVLFTLSYTDASDIVMGDIGTCNISVTDVGEDVTYTSYTTGVDFLRKPVATQILGTLTYLQAFCRYQGKYYSTNGSNVGVQDDTFASVTTKSLSVGHGNSFQIGSNGVAYVSGWNDQKVYAVDLSDLTITSEIDLGTEGYTTAAIDDINGVAYIFQRDSYPNSVINYNFIVYDYVHQQVISRRIINAFSALQAVDYYNGRIVVLWGLGTAASPSGMAIYNTTGDILAEYTLDIFATVEPEGVCFDRDTGDLLVSDVNRTVYLVTGV